jgi:hypothetical protein
VNLPPVPSQATGYTLRIAGHLDGRWSVWFDGLTMTHEDDGTTTLYGDVADQSALHGLLAKVRDLGVTLLSVQAMGETAETPCGPGQPFT